MYLLAGRGRDLGAILRRAAHTDPKTRPQRPLPPAGPAGRPPVHSRREIVNAILYLTRTGCAWRMLPRDLPPWQTVYRYFAAWRDDGTLDRVHDALRERVRVKQEGRNPRALGGDRGLPVSQGR